MTHELTCNVFLTGGAGFLGRGLLRRARLEGWPATWTIFSRDDSKHVSLMARYPEVSCIRGDVAGDLDYLTAAMRGHDLVIHAAAVKYVDLAEGMAWDTARVNIHGSEQVARAAVRAGVGTIVGISTDKACAPVNVYGMSKAVMERVFTEATNWSPDSHFTCVRYGNVVGSTGSVIPLFKRQFAETGKVRVTNPDMTRFWMSVDEAIDCILYAVEEADDGSIVVPTPRAMNMANVVHAAVGAVNMEIVGTRPGEKMHEDLVHLQESVRAQERFSFDLRRAFYEVRPPGEVVHEAPFVLSSACAERMPPAEMVELIEDAATV